MALPHRTFAAAGHRPAVVWLGTGHGRRARGAAALALAVALAGGAAWFGSQLTTPAPHVASARGVPVRGHVFSEGGPPVLGGGPDIHPIMSAPILVTGFTTSGMRLVRRLAADRHGRFELALPPGRYTFAAAIYEGSIKDLHATVRVRAGHQPRVRLRDYVN
jgi:hypothetical protein